MMRPHANARDACGSDTLDRPKRVLLLTAPVGEGHVAAARTLAEDIVREREGAEVVVCDVLPALGRPLRWLLHDAYRWQLKSAPWLFGVLFAALRRSSLLRAVARAGLSLAGSRGVLRLVRRHSAHVIVSTWPPATMILGSLRLRGKVRVPACATITDFAGLELWANKGIDLHLVMHESLVPGVERVAGRGSACPVSPLVAASFLTPRSSAEARNALGLPTAGRVVVVSGGGWAVGDLEGAVRTALELDETSVVCLSGREEARRTRLEHTFAGEPRVNILGFTDTMSDLLAAADVLVHSTGGVTCLEALVRGCPIVAYGAPPGHAPLLAHEMAALGLVVNARSEGELRDALVTTAAGRPSSVASLARGIDAASAVLGAAPRVAVRLRARLARTAATAATVVVMLVALFASDATYPVVAEALALPATTSLSPTGNTVGLVIRGERPDLLVFAHAARMDNLHASVAPSTPLTTADVALLRAAGLDPIPEISAGGVAAAFGARKQLADQVASYGLKGHFYYLAPHEGFTITDYLLARELGGAPLQPGSDLPTSVSGFASLRAGEVVVTTLESDSPHDRARLQMSLRRLERSGLVVSSVQRLASGRRTS